MEKSICSRTLDGHLRMHFHNGEGLVLSNGENCPDVRCNQYIRIEINGQLDYTSAIKMNTNSPIFNFDYFSRTISKNDQIIVELWNAVRPISTKINSSASIDLLNKPLISQADEKSRAKVDRSEFFGEFESQLMSMWQYYPIIGITSTNRLEGYNWGSGKQNKIFFSAEWIEASSPSIQTHYMEVL